MFDYDANIRVNINDTAALAALKKLEDRIAQLSDPRTAGALKNLRGSLNAKEEFSALKQERAEDLAYRKRKSRQIADELRLSNAIELQEGRRIKLQRAGAQDVASRKKAIAKLDKIAAANPKNAEIQERVATGLARILTTQNEINRATNKNIGQKQRIADYNKQIDKLRELGATEGQLRKAQKRKYEFIDAAERRQTSLSDRRELQLKRELKLLGDAQKAARDAATAVTRPGTLSGGARSALSSGPARSVLGSPAADKARFDFYEKNYKTALAEVFKTEQAYEKQLQTNSLNNIKAEEAAELASINRVAAAEKAQNKRINDEEKQSDKLQRAKEAGIAKSAKAAGKGQGLLGFGQTATNLSAGAGFPLLFGGGPGSVLGGVGGALLGGFGGSIIGGALGQQLDALGAAALSTADAFGKLGATASDLIPKLGSGAGNGFGDRAQFLIDEGSQAQVGEILRTRFAEVYGDKALKDFEKLAETNKEFKKTMEQLGVQFQLLIDGPLEGLLKIINKINFKAKKDDELTPQELKVRKLEQRNRSFGPTITQANIDELNEAKAALTETTTTQEDTNKTNAEKALIDLVKQKAAIEEKVNNDKLAAVSQALTARRDELAVLNTAASITRASAELDNTRKELAAERLNTIKDIYRITQLEKTEAEQAAELERQQIAQANALLQAQLQIKKDTQNAIIATSKVDNEIYQTRLKTQALEQNATGQYQTKLTAIRQEAKSQEDVLRAKFELRKLDIKELEVKIEEAMLLEAKVEKIKVELALKEKQIQQADTLRRIGVDQYNQQQELNTLLAEQNALRAIQANNPERTLGFAGAGLGYFGGSANLEADLFQKYNDDIDVFNRKIANAKKNFEALTPAEINDGRADPFLKELDTTEVLLANYKRLQPAVNAAAVEQQQFNDALAAVTPGVNSLVGGLQEVVAGTKSAEEAFADFLNVIADQLIQTAAVLIAQYIAIGLAKAFAGLSSGGGSSPGIQRALDVTPKTGAAATSTLNTFLSPRANGGPVNANTPYIVGERGPELMIPSTSGMVLSNSETRQQLDRQQAVASTREQLDRQQSTASTMQPLDIRYESTVINSVEYVTAAQHRQGMAQAAERGRAMTLTTLQNSPRTRSKVGI